MLIDSRSVATNLAAGEGLLLRHAMSGKGVVLEMTIVADRWQVVGIHAIARRRHQIHYWPRLLRDNRLAFSGPSQTGKSQQTRRQSPCVPSIGLLQTYLRARRAEHLASAAVAGPELLRLLCNIFALWKRLKPVRNNRTPLFASGAYYFRFILQQSGKHICKFRRAPAGGR